MNSGLSYSSRNRKLKEYICIVCVHVCLYHETFNQQTLKGVKQSSSDLEKQLTSSESEQLSMQRKIEKLTTELQHMVSIEIEDIYMCRSHSTYLINHFLIFVKIYGTCRL